MANIGYLKPRAIVVITLFVVMVLIVAFQVNARDKKMDNNQFNPDSIDLCTEMHLYDQEKFISRGLMIIPPIGLNTKKKWTYTTLKVKFLDGDSNLHEQVKNISRIWEKYCGIRFDYKVYASGVTPDISITFKQSGSWSYVGTDSRRVTPSMNLGILTGQPELNEFYRVVLHEFGHAIGLIHEHQSPTAKIPWNEEAVYSYYMNPDTYHWTENEVRENILKKYDKSIIMGSVYDSKSIMVYAIPKEITVNESYSVKPNYRLSDSDIVYIQKMYPQR